MSADSTVIAALEDIRQMVRDNTPRHGNPERFHEVKSDITLRLTQVVEALRTGRPIRHQGGE